MSNEPLQTDGLVQEAAQQIVGPHGQGQLAQADQFEVVDAYRASPLLDENHLPNYGSPQPHGDVGPDKRSLSRPPLLEAYHGEELKCATPSFVRDENADQKDHPPDSRHSPNPEQRENPQNPPASAQMSSNFPKLTEPDGQSEREQIMLVTLDPQQNALENQITEEVPGIKISSAELGHENMSKGSQIITTPGSVTLPLPEKGSPPKIVITTDEQKIGRSSIDSKALVKKPRTPEDNGVDQLSMQSSQNRKQSAPGAQITIEAPIPAPPPPPPHPEGSQTTKRPNPRVIQHRNATPSK
jgi:hypothetical protein